MNPVGKALWFIESHFTEDISLEDIANVGGVSRYHMSRAFGIVTGNSITRYVRGRRLTEAAKLLANGAPDILSVALDVGYGSHEAFSRAFRDHFGITPETVRAQHHLDNIERMEPIKMEETLIQLEPPRFQNSKPLLIAGLSQRYTAETCASIAAQWQRFGPYIGHIPGQVGRTAYGVCCNCDEAGNLEYISGVEVADFSLLPSDLARLRIPEHRYAVFTHREHISRIRSTWHTILNEWMPKLDHVVDDAPDFERYGEDFDPRTGTGCVEIWIPVSK
jgi:AraC family transcriptional regulator